MKAYFKHDYETKIVPEIAQYYRERKIGCVIFTVGSEAATGHPVISPDRWLKDFEKIDIRPDVRPLILKENAIRLLGLR
jgi:predicted TIM-barrel fold metal-dependent hydrolase